MNFNEQIFMCSVNFFILAGEASAQILCLCSLLAVSFLLSGMFVCIFSGTG